MSDPGPLISVEWLRTHLEDPDVVVLDASVHLTPAEEGRPRGEFRSGLDEYLKGHIPGARFADLFTEFSDPTSRYPFTRPTREQFEVAAGRLGITSKTSVVVYDGLVGQWAARLWWVFRTHGHNHVGVLDGGLQRFLASGGTLEADVPSYPKATYKSEGPVREFARTEDIEAIVGGQRRGALVCLLQPSDFSGAIQVRARAGHIPGSVNVPFTQLVDVSSNMLRAPDRIRSLFQTVTPLEGELVVTYCGGGIASTLGALALAVIGYDNTLEYDGSLAEWIDEPARPLATGFS